MSSFVSSAIFNANAMSASELPIKNSPGGISVICMPITVRLDHIGLEVARPRLLVLLRFRRIERSHGERRCSSGSRNGGETVGEADGLAMVGDVVFGATGCLGLFLAGVMSGFTCTEPPAGTLTSAVLPSGTVTSATVSPRLFLIMRMTPNSTSKNPAAPAPIRSLVYFRGGCFPWPTLFGLRIVACLACVTGSDETTSLFGSVSTSGPA